MNEERRRILSMLAEGKISAAEAESLLDAMNAASPGNAEQQPALRPKYLRVQVDGHDGGRAGRVNVRVPFNLVRAGVRLAALLPTAAHGPINKALKENGVDIDVSKLKPEDFDDLVEHLTELTVDVEGPQGEKVRVYCE
jgi:SHOCT-like protein